MVFHAKSVNEIIATVTVEQRSIAECVLYELKVLKNDLRFTQRHTEPLHISRNLSEKSLIDVLSYAKGKLGHRGGKNFCTPLYMVD